MRIVRALYSSDSFIINAYLKFFWTPKKNSLQEFILAYATGKSNFSVLQIGANDGLINDPICKLIRKERWAGVLVEPQKLVFDTYLKPLYKNYPHIQLINCAIGKSDSVEKLFVISFSAERWATGLASFVRKSIETKINDGYVDQCVKRFNEKAPESKENYIATQEVNCISFKTLFAKTNLQKIDLLQIDTEGFDFELLKMFPFEIVKPGLISFESEHLSPEDALACELYLKKLGYNVSPIDRDSVAVLM